MLLEFVLVVFFKIASKYTLVNTLTTTLAGNKNE
jgi:hypothetical protein